jgi:hypothetical protein
MCNSGFISRTQTASSCKLCRAWRELPTAPRAEHYRCAGPLMPGGRCQQLHAGSPDNGHQPRLASAADPELEHQSRLSHRPVGNVYRADRESGSGRKLAGRNVATKGTRSTKFLCVMEPGSDLMLLHLNGSEEVLLVKADGYRHRDCRADSSSCGPSSVPVRLASMFAVDFVMTR